MNKTAVIVAPVDDVHAKAVINELRSFNVDVVHFDCEELPDNILLSQGVGAEQSGRIFIKSQNKHLDLSSIHSVWWRRVSPHRINKTVKQYEAIDFSKRSSRSSLISALESNADRVVNSYGLNEAARHKGIQASLAIQEGLDVPETLISNNIEDIRHFYGQHKEVVYKTLVTWHFGLKETRKLKESDLDENSNFHHAPTIFQRYIEGVYDLRITVIGEKIYPAAIYYKEGRSKIDGRLDRVPIEEVELPKSFEEKLLKLHSELGLTYGAYDFRLGEDGKYYFLEVNPEGQYLFVEIKSGLEISKGIAEYLACA